MEQFGFHWVDFNEIQYLRIFQKSVEKIYLYLKSDKDNRYCTRRPIYIFNNIFLNSSHNEKFFRPHL